MEQILLTISTIKINFARSFKKNIHTLKMAFCKMSISFIIIIAFCVIQNVFTAASTKSDERKDPDELFIPQVPFYIVLISFFGTIFMLFATILLFLWGFQKITLCNGQYGQTDEKQRQFHMESYTNIVEP